MYYQRASGDRGQADIGWLNSRHTFSFGSYYDPAHMGFGSLRVINDDQVAPGGGFAEHGHEDMEIISVVLSGRLEHRDSMGNGSVIAPGDVQRMTAGSGIRHSEFNASDSEAVNFLQIWVLPEVKGLAPGYEQQHFPAESRRDVLKLLASRDGREGSITIHQDVLLYGSILSEGQSLTQALDTARRYWLHVYEGALRVNDELTLHAGDSVGITAAEMLNLEALEEAGLLFFDMGDEL